MAQCANTHQTVDLGKHLVWLGARGLQWYSVERRTAEFKTIYSWHCTLPTSEHTKCFFRRSRQVSQVQKDPSIFPRHKSMLPGRENRCVCFQFSLMFAKIRECIRCGIPSWWVMCWQRWGVGGKPHTAGLHVVKSGLLLTRNMAGCWSERPEKEMSSFWDKLLETWQYFNSYVVTGCYKPVACSHS